MSYKVLVIPEDPTHNGYILKPLMQAILAEAGKPLAKVDVLTNPKLGGYDHALRAIKEELPERYGFWDLWIFMPDADRASPAAMADLEANLAAKNVALLCCPAQPEVEIYACAAYRKEIAVDWTSARVDPRMKEDVFQPLLKNLPLLLQLCPELQDLCDRIAAKI